MGLGFHFLFACPEAAGRDFSLMPLARKTLAHGCGGGGDSLEEEDSAPAKAEDEETLSGDAMDSLGTGPPSAADEEERTITGVPVTALL